MFLPALLLSSSFSFSFSTRYVGPSGPTLTRAGDCWKAEQFKICTQFPRATGAVICFSSVGSCSTGATALSGLARRGAAWRGGKLVHALDATFSRLFVSGLARRGAARHGGKLVATIPCLRRNILEAVCLLVSPINIDERIE